MVVNPAFPAQSVSEFVAYANTNPGKTNMASAGVGSPSHVAGELFKMMTGVNLTHVPYRGSAPAATDLIAGQVQVLFGDIASSIEHIRAGKLRALAMMTAKPLDVLPEVPVIAGLPAGFEMSSWQGLCAPRNTPAAIIDKLNGEINAILADQQVKAQVKDLGLRVLSGSPTDFRELIGEDTEKWAKVVRFAGVKAN
jgi:tripartite-type tricarboxylate transporter receptor subunit TctC